MEEGRKKMENKNATYKAPNQTFYFCILTCVTVGCFNVVTFLIFSQGDWLFDTFMGVEIHD